MGDWGVAVFDSLLATRDATVLAAAVGEVGAAAPAMVFGLAATAAAGGFDEGLSDGCVTTPAAVSAMKHGQQSQARTQ